MAYASQTGRARVSTTAPEAHGICGRCQFRYLWKDLQVQYEWRGATLMPLGNLRFCYRCIDVPQEQLRSIILPQDPVPVVPAQPELYSSDSLDYLGTGPPTISPRTGLPIPSQDVLGGATVDDIIPQPLGPGCNLGAECERSAEPECFGN